MNPAFIYFDLDDTLLDHRSAEQAALADLHGMFDLFEGVSLEELSDTYHAINRDLWERYGNNELDRDALQHLRFRNTLEALGVDGDPEDLGSRYMRRYQDHWQWITGADRALRKVSGHFETGILTNGFKEVQKQKISRFGLDSYVRHIVISEEVGYLKPQKEIFEHATELAGTEPGSILYIGDSLQSDVIGGSEYGWVTAWYCDGSDAGGQERADLVFNKFETLYDYLGI